MVKLEFRPVLVQFRVKLSFPGLRTRPGKVILSNFGNNWFKWRNNWFELSVHVGIQLTPLLWQTSYFLQRSATVNNRPLWQPNVATTLLLPARNARNKTFFHCWKHSTAVVYATLYQPAHLKVYFCEPTKVSPKKLKPFTQNVRAPTSWALEILLLSWGHYRAPCLIMLARLDNIKNIFQWFEFKVVGTYFFFIPCHITGELIHFIETEIKQRARNTSSLECHLKTQSHFSKTKVHGNSVPSGLLVTFTAIF